MHKILYFNEDWCFSKTAEVPAVLPDDVKKLAVPVFAHRIITRTGYGVAGKAAQVVNDLLRSVAVPTEDPNAEKLV